MRNLGGVRAILLDLDGTLADTAPDIVAAVEATLAALDLPLLDEKLVRTFIGRGVDVLLHRILTGERDGSAAHDLHGRARDVFFREYGESNGRTATLYPGVIDGLERMRRLGIPAACVTNKLQHFSDALVAKLGLDRFLKLVIGGDALAERKPHPAPLLHAAALLGVEADACLMIGDSANDALAARAAHMPVVLVDYGYTEDVPLDSIDCDAVVSSIDDVIASIEAARTAPTSA